MIVEKLPENLHKDTTSLNNEGLGIIENKKLLDLLLKKQKQLYNELTNIGFRNISQRWITFCDSLEEEVTLKDRQIKGKIIKINEKGYLVIKKDSGKLLEIFSNEII